MTFEEYFRWEAQLGPETENALEEYKEDILDIEGHWQEDMKKYSPYIRAAFALSTRYFLANYQKGD